MPPPWSPRELATLAAIATTFVPGDDGERRPARITEALERAADPAQVRQFRLGIRAMETPPAEPTLSSSAKATGRTTRGTARRPDPGPMPEWAVRDLDG